MRLRVKSPTGSNSTLEAIGLVDHAKKIGADAALTVCPYYNRPGQQGLINHFLAIADAVEMPLVLYNVPSRTVVDLEPETLGVLSKHPNIIGIKDATGDVGRVAWHRQLCEKNFCLLSGDDTTSIGFSAMGGAGCISVTANVAPIPMAAMHNAVLDGNFAEAARINQTLQRLHRALFLESSPAPTKFALAELGLIDPEVRSPILEMMSDAAKQEIRTAMEEAGVTS